MSLLRVGDLAAPEEGVGLRVECEKISVGCAANDLAVFHRSAAIGGKDFLRARLPNVFPAEAAIFGVDGDCVVGGGEVENAVVNQEARLCGDSLFALI